jgi:hypothetical protein
MDPKAFTIKSEVRLRQLITVCGVSEATILQLTPFHQLLEITMQFGIPVQPGL